MKNILNYKIPFYVSLIELGLCLLAISYFYSLYKNERSVLSEVKAPVISSNSASQIRLQDYVYTKPLLLGRDINESENLQVLKNEIETRIEQLKASGIINDASVYIKFLNNNKWISVNSSATYEPGSILKIAAVMTYLKMCERDQRLFNKEFLFNGNKKMVLQQTFNEEKLTPGKKYSVKEILYEILVKSNNEATSIINNSIDIDLFKKLFNDLEIPVPDVHDIHYKMNVMDISKFLRVLYNATYLSNDNSEFCLSLLAQSSFRLGIVNELPVSCKVVHKFGETGSASEAQLHETAIFYNEDKTYLITVMTKGRDVHRLPEALSSISKITFDNLNSY